MFVGNKVPPFVARMEAVPAINVHRIEAHVEDVDVLDGGQRQVLAGRELRRHVLEHRVVLVADARVERLAPLAGVSPAKSGTVVVPLVQHVVE